MLNNVILVGRLVNDPEVKTLENGTSVASITLAVMKGFKNQNGETEVDFIKCSLWEGVATAASSFCKKGSIIGVKGRLASRDYTITFENGESKTIKTIEVIGERISFIKI